MATDTPTILIMAAGTGGHVFPALSIAQKLREKGVRAEWLGTTHGMENALLADTDITIHAIAVKGLKGKGLLRKLVAPFMIIQAILQSIQVIRRTRPSCVLGMGGFVSGPGGMAAKLMGKRLLIHEQNGIAGTTNKILAKFADRVFEAFPGTFAASDKVLHTGNPLREEILLLRKNPADLANSTATLRVLVLGGSQGAAAINSTVPSMLAKWTSQDCPEVLHQTGKRNYDTAIEEYQRCDLQLSDNLRVVPFINDMSAAYRWADVVVCRSGASTVSEIAAIGLPSVLIPYPYHSDNQQKINAQWLSKNSAAILMLQDDLTVDLLLQTIKDLSDNRIKLQNMSQQASSIALRDASNTIANECMEIAYA